MYCEYAQYLEIPYCGYCLYFSSFMFRYCGCVFSCDICVTYCSYTLVLAICGPFQFSQYFSHQYSNILSTRATNCARAFSVKPLFYPERREIVCGGIIFCTCSIVLSRPRGLPVCRNLDQTHLFCTYVYGASIEFSAATHLFMITIHLPVSSFILLLISLDYFRKQQISARATIDVRSRR